MTTDQSAKVVTELVEVSPVNNLRRVQLYLKPNPQPLPYKGRGARFKASLRVGEPARCGGSLRCSDWRERFGEGFQR
ncbi:hypothetical protein [Nostoc piscinale]|uniref:hypothetical protein n=1 Tax=Nostoc piscinale TaxID=224012 RepID=UPI0011877453|nr:hypothetical protein [Nostoc piscinale]